jgi:hypothetical protein
MTGHSGQSVKRIAQVLDEFPEMLSITGVATRRK